LEGWESRPQNLPQKFWASSKIFSGPLRSGPDDRIKCPEAGKLVKCRYGTKAAITL
jgi:hypothetical protein